MRAQRNGRSVRTAAFVLGLGVLGIFALLPSAAATPQPTTRAAPAPDLSTVPKIKSYLRSLGVDPRGVVVQRGERNYAGPNCPGVSWNCTNSLKVVQISTRAVDDDDDDENENRFVCDGSKPRTITKSQTTPAGQTIQSCEIVQLNSSNAKNSATCDLATHRSQGTITQTCKINQSGSRNSAFAKQVARMSASGTEQDVFQTISVKQTSFGSAGNTLDTAQGVLLNSGPDAGSEAVKQDVHQLNCVNQDAAGSGPNVARSGQSQIVIARKHGADLEPAAEDISQNTELVEALCTGPAVPFPTTFHPETADCAVVAFSNAKDEANACSRIHQESDTGKQTIQLGQLDSLFAEVKDGSGDLDVQQGTDDFLADTGTTGTLDQHSVSVTNPGLSQISFGGLTTQVTSIHGIEDLDFYFVDQNDTGPQCCAAGHQDGNPGNDFAINGRLFQRLIVDGDVPNPEEDDLPGYGEMDQDGTVYGDCVTSGVPASSGGCTVDINATNNADPDGDPAQCGPSSVCHEQVDCFAFVGGKGGSEGGCSNAPPSESASTRGRRAR